MLDAAKQRDWYQVYLRAALLSETHGTPAAAKRWARAMALIAEQFVAYEGAEAALGAEEGW